MYRKKRKDNKNKLLYKAFLCVIGIVALFYISFSYRNYKMKEDKAPYVQVREILPVLDAFFDVNSFAAKKNEEVTNIKNFMEKLEEKQGQEEKYVTYDEVLTILQCFPINQIGILDDYKNGDWYFSLADWNTILEILVQKYGNGQITLQDKILLGSAQIISDEKDVMIADNQVLTETGIAENKYWNIESYFFSKSKAVCYKNDILTVTGYSDTPGEIENVYLVDGTSETLHFFWNGYHMKYPTSIFKNISDKYTDSVPLRKITDITFYKGSMQITKEKEEYIHGKLLQVSEDFIEIEGYGVYPVDINMQVYKLYGELASMEMQDLRLGYSFTDFVVDDGKIAACLMIKEEDMDYIRVLIKNSDLEGIYHDVFLGYCDMDCEIIIYENGTETSRIAVGKGERFTVNAEDIKVGRDRIKVVPSVLSAKTVIESINRNQGIPSYYGTLEITREEDGLIVINEVLLEDYLCKVVPSEMPSTYPKEALKAQAVCARTYAYGKMLNAGLPELGAHVDDSAGFQVYNNIAEQVTATEAVKDTHNIITVFDNEPIGAYYYSTSCGMGADTGVWHSGANSPMYLQAKEIGTIQNDENQVNFANISVTPDELTDEEQFRKWIMNVDDSHYESQEGWYRWTYEVNMIDVAHMEDVLKKRYRINPNFILTQNANKEFESKEIEGLGEIKEIEIVKRLTGGVADELVITGTKATVKVISELNIRYVLSDGLTKVKRQTGDEADASSMLPSAFFVIDTCKEDGEVTGYKISGGGFGHGVGMSQNGAKNMAMDGMTYDEIILFCYPGVTLKTLQPGE